MFHNLSNGVGAGTTELHVVRPILVSPDYILIFLKSPHVIETGIPRMTGTAGQKRVPREYFANSPFPVPPRAEQQRIVAKVDELMALCDQLEAAQAKRESRRDRLTRASLHRLNQPADPSDADTFRGHARFVLDHLPRLTTRVGHITELRQTILNLAVHGRLVEQDPNDEPAPELVKRVHSQKAQLARSGKLRKLEANRRIEDSDLPFSVPSTWCWTQLASICLKIHYGYTASANQALEDVKLLRITDIQNNAVDWSSVPGCEISDDDIDRFKLKSGDILIARTGGTVGKTFLIREIPVNAVFASYLIRVQASPEVHERYLKLFMESPVYWIQLQDGARGGGQPNVNAQTLGQMCVPLPPLAEQKRVVAKVDEIMALCERLEKQVTVAQSARRRLLEAVLHEALDEAAEVDNAGKQENLEAAMAAH